jgi:hypothetical protein
MDKTIGFRLWCLVKAYFVLVGDDVLVNSKTF